MNYMFPPNYIFLSEKAEKLDVLIDVIFAFYSCKKTMYSIQYLSIELHNNAAVIYTEPDKSKGFYIEGIYIYSFGKDSFKYETVINRYIADWVTSVFYNEHEEDRQYPWNQKAKIGMRTYKLQIKPI